MSLKESLRHAFALGDDASFGDAEKALAEKLADFVVRRSMGEAALMLLESMRPLSFLSSQALHALQPFATAVFNPDEYRRFAAMLENRGSIPLLIDAIEARMGAATPGDPEHSERP